jgi:ElaB/YqjD/DUF883 family membrane-anchored ribosome-binding protein
MATEKDFQKDMDALRADLAALADTVNRLATETADVHATVKKNFKKAAKRAAGVGEQFAEDAKHLGDHAAEAASDAAAAGMATLEDQIKRHPMTAVLGALGVGFLLGVMGRK